jgi:hypothetical protein
LVVKGNQPNNEKKVENQIMKKPRCEYS